MCRRGIFVFGGVDGAGKSTQIRLLAERLEGRGIPVRFFWARGGYTPLFSAAKGLLRRVRPGALPPPGHSTGRERKFGSSRVRRVWLMVAITDLALCYGVWLRWHRCRGRTVLCDRYLEDTLIDFRRNFPAEKVEQWRLWRLLQWLTPKPDAAFLLLLPVDESQRRCRQKEEPFPDTPETLAWRLEQYETLSRSGGWKRIDARRPLAEIHEEIAAIIER